LETQFFELEFLSSQVVFCEVTQRRRLQAVQTITFFSTKTTLTQEKHYLAPMMF
jgi:hypothetical protein